MLTCNQFLDELSDFLDECTHEEIRTKLEHHLSKCPNCWVICDTTRKTINVYKGMKECSIPEDMHSRLMAAMDRKLRSEGQA